MDSLEQRIMDLERRVALLEQRGHAPQPLADASRQASADDKADPDRALSLVRVEVSNKRYDPANPSLGSYENHSWFDCLYTPSGLTKPARAIKGLLEFADNFGEVKFRIQVTLNESLSPGRPLPQKGIGFTYNQFMEQHQWMLVTKVPDMKCTLRLTNLLYMDGTTETFP